jgi:hypothetical protein
LTNIREQRLLPSRIFPLVIIFPTFTPALLVDGDELIRIPGEGHRGEGRREIEVDALIGESGGGEDGREPNQLARLHSGLLHQFPPGAGLGRLARFQCPGGNLPEHAIGRMPELMNQEDPGVGAGRIVEEGHYRRGAWVADHLQHPGGAIRETHGVLVHVDHATLVEALRIDECHGQ